MSPLHDILRIFLAHAVCQKNMKTTLDFQMTCFRNNELLQCYEYKSMLNFGAGRSSLSTWK